MTAVTLCQSCSSPDLESMLWLGQQVACNDYRPINAPPSSAQTYPLELLRCPRCELIQLSYLPPKETTFPASYPYRSGTTKLLRDNFADLARMVHGLMRLKADDLVVDIGSNDGTLLSNFAPLCRVLGVTPEDVAVEANKRGIPTLQHYFNASIASELLSGAWGWELQRVPGNARVITAANVFAHVPDPNDFLEGVKMLLAPGGIFVSESTYLHDTLDKLQFDTIYAEHARYLSLRSIAYQLNAHGLEAFRVEHIATHGGSIRVWACRKGERPIEPSVATLAYWEYHKPTDRQRFDRFAADIARVRQELWRALPTGGVVHGVGAPSRASVLCQFVGLDHHVMPVVYETAGSGKIGQYMPGSRVAVVEEPETFGDEQPEWLLLLSHHIADELIPKLRGKGFRGHVILPLPEVRIDHAHGGASI